jgi:hypothetical protein
MFATTHRGMTCRAIPAPGRDGVTSGTPKGQTFRKRRWVEPKCRNGIKDLSARWRLYLGSKKAFNKTIRQTVELEIAK